MMNKPERLILKTDDSERIAFLLDFARARQPIVVIGKGWLIEHYSTHAVGSSFTFAYRGVFELVACGHSPGPSFIEVSG